jgi:CBS domain-containing protein
MTATVIDELMMSDVERIDADDTVRNAKRRMESNALRSLIVVDETIPVGIIQRTRLLKIGNEEMDRPVTAFMVTDFPTLKRGDTVTDAQQRMGHDVNFEQIPVVSDTGDLVGAVHRERLAHAGTPASATPGASETETSYELAPVREGMTVKDSAGSKLGKLVDADYSSSGNVEFFTVERGLIFKKQKRLPGDLIREIEGDEIQLAIDQMEFGMMRDVGDEAV